MKGPIIIFAFLLLLVSGCFYNDPVPVDQNVWPVAPPAKFDMNEQTLLTLDSIISVGPSSGISSIVIIKEGHLVYEKYYHGRDRSTFFGLSGVSSSIANIAVGKAIELGVIGSLDDSIYKYLPAYAQIFEDEPIKKNITFKHLMELKSGLTWSEFSGGFDELLSDNDKMVLSDDWVEYILSQPLDSYPGSRFTFNSAISIVLSAAIHQAYGKSYKIFLENEVFSDLGIGEFQIDEVGGNLNSAWGMSMRTLDVAKLGYLYLEEGDWFGRQFLEPSYVQSSSQIQTHIDFTNDFGWLWWRYADNNFFVSFLAENDVFFASGLGNERLYIVPHLDLVVAFTGTVEADVFALSSPFAFREYILGSMHQ